MDSFNDYILDQSQYPPGKLVPIFESRHMSAGIKVCQSSSDDGYHAVFTMTTKPNSEIHSKMHESWIEDLSCHNRDVFLSAFESMRGEMLNVFVRHSLIFEDWGNCPRCNHETLTVHYCETPFCMHCLEFSDVATTQEVLG